ncbi:hypothetical protein DICPUDRAFT_93750 [Dictyostelium purpureum]|uniref:Uncharacterized protein n=1 Tax=Dictyostelium purpureum TaxID=5786 RepID=F0ZB65_DICPU|nr:uncharacterized protein DICPUDRAFT_93750 [Dictyostelium purpureum]EGC38837.1 hypothetical protein DICPUDRAFT_93750 [Dictyostelium purpureum]|eukprot:XP_003284631.1 hypothetical protein DICPUDRAFT_93750 [Dictyostelium purpureum]
MTNTNKVWYITGVTSGAGFALCSTLLEKGYHVCGTSRSLNRINQLPFVSNNNFLGLEVDITNEESVKKSIKRVIDKFGEIDVVVNNAGQSIMGNVEEITDKEQRMLMDVLYFGPCNVIRAVLPHFRLRKNGLIINISSVFGEASVPLFSSYCAGKAALSAMTYSLHEELKPFNIRVICIMLGYLDTNFKNPTTSNPIGEYKLESTFNKMKKTFGRHNKESPVNFAKFIIQNSMLDNPPLKFIYRKNPKKIN